VMGIFGNRKTQRGLANKEIPTDPHDPLIEDLHRSYPYGNEAFGMRSIIHIVVWTVLRMKDLGYLK
jgi:hypothetical protein